MIEVVIESQNLGAKIVQFWSKVLFMIEETWLFLYGFVLMIKLVQQSKS
jgi:hypothetical protein